MKHKSLVFLLLAVIILNSFTIQKNEPGQDTYETYCIACHQANGKGTLGINPPLVDSDWVSGDKTRLIKTVILGLNEPQIINGVIYNNAMPAHDYLEDTELANLLTFVRKKYGEMPDSVTVAEVKSVRESLK